jgi:hypothetical protein
LVTSIILETRPLGVLDTAPDQRLEKEYFIFEKLFGEHFFSDQQINITFLLRKYFSNKDNQEKINL